ncbi:MFS transporter [Streptomyces sp. NPDC006465]|uniref:MFS transporter n=1 Tax=Streptomyces sp. NPDC006465 TaxID=3157174 RepID=UPI0033BD3CC0
MTSTLFPAVRRSPNFTPVLLFVNACGSFLLLVSLSTRVGSATGSGLLAGAVLSAPWLPALLLAHPLNRLLRRHPPEHLVRAAEAASLVLTLAALAAPGRALAAVATVLVLARGFCEALTRSATSVALRAAVDPGRLERANTLAEIGKLTGVSLGAALAGPAAAVLPLRGLVAVNAVLLALSALLAWALPSPAGNTRANTTAGTDRTDGEAAGGAGGAGGAGEGAEGGRLRVTDPVLRRLFARFLLVAFWQGFHTVAVTVIPLQVLGGGTRLVGVFVAVSSVAVFAGSLTALPAQRHLGHLPSAAWALAPMPFLATAVLAGRTAPTLVLYALFLVLFEVAYVHFNNRLLAAATTEQLPAVVTLRATLLPLGVVVSILLTGALCDLAGPLPTALAVAAVSVLVTASTSTSGQTWRSPVRDT